jgi:hypothetical protein
LCSPALWDLPMPMNIIPQKNLRHAHAMNVPAPFVPVQIVQQEIVIAAAATTAAVKAIQAAVQDVAVSKLFLNLKTSPLSIIKGAFFYPIMRGSYKL